MPLKSIEIHGFRGFQNKGKLEFAIADGNTPGSGLTILTGPNNSGKSSILECLRGRAVHSSPSFSEGSRNKTIDSVEIIFEVEVDQAIKVEAIRSINKGSSETKKEIVDNNLKIFVLQSRRSFRTYFAKSSTTREIYITSSSGDARRQTELGSFSQRLFAIAENKLEQERFNNILHQVLTFKPTWTIDQSDIGQHFLKFTNGNHSHTSEGMGEGIVSLFAIIDSLYDSNPGDVIAIDEPELSLHPNLQKRLCTLLSEYAIDRQIIISTHSPYFIDLTALKSGGTLARVTTGDEGTVIHQISVEAKGLIEQISNGNLNNPHVFGLDAKELFFLDDKVILTEGQEDVIFYPKIAAQLGITFSGDFFGWGAGGAGNIEHLCSILKTLGYKSVAGLLDGDKVDERNNLEKSFPDYIFHCIPAHDIRTKKAQKEKAEIQGLLDKSLNIRSEHVEPTRSIFNALTQYFQ